MRKIILISALVLGSSVAFAQFTGPVENSSNNDSRAMMHQVQDHPMHSGMNGMHQYQQTGQSEKGYSNHMRRSDRQHGEHYKNHQNRSNREYRGEHRRHGDMKQYSQEQRRMHRDSSRRGNPEMHRNGSRHAHHNR